MSYSNCFQHADDVVSHLDGFVPNLAVSSPLLSIKYVGFVAIAGVTVYELAIREIFSEFARRKHKTFGSFVDTHFSRINGRIKLQTIRDEHVARFGERYRRRFERRIERRSREYLVLNRRDIKSAYGNLITWRNQFAHEGQLNVTVTYAETVQAYEDGKNVVHCLAECMTR